MTDIEIRPFSAADDVEVRSIGGRLVLSGTAIRYGARSKDLGGFRERIMPGAAKAALKGEIVALDEHRSERYLGRTGNSTLRLLDDKEALRYEVDLPDTAIGREVAHYAERRDYRGSSFGFQSLAAKWTTDDDGMPLRSITAFKMIRDVGPTVFPAYDDSAAEVALRCLPSEAQFEVEVRSVLEAAKAGRLAELIERDGIALEELRSEAPPEEDSLGGEHTLSPPVIHRRPAYWFV